MVKLRTLLLLGATGLAVMFGATKFFEAQANDATSNVHVEALPLAPDFSKTTTTGDVFTLSEVSTDKTVVLEWSNHECPFVVKHYTTPPANMQSLQLREDDDSVIWVTIVSSAPGKQGHITTAEAAELTTSRNAAPDHIILDEDGSLGRLYNAKTTPHMYVVDDGKLAYQGAIDSVRSARVRDIEKAENYVNAALDALAAGEVPSPSDTKPYGCSIKYGKKAS